MRILIALAPALALLSTPALADENKQDEDKIVCKRSESFNTGSHLSRPKKTCRKASEWKELDDDKEETFRKVQDGRYNPNPAPAAGGTPQ